MTQSPVVGAVLEGHGSQVPDRPGGGAEVAAALVRGRVPGAELRTVRLDITRPPHGAAQARARIVQADPQAQGGLLGVEVSVWDDQGITEEGTVTLWAPNLAAADLEDRRRVASPEWGRLVAAELEGMPEFSKAADYYDGTIGLLAPGRSVQFKIYKGRVVDVARRTVKGADFTLSASGGTWLDLLTTPTNEFMHRAMDGAFTTDGDGYEYLRTTKLLFQVIDAARAIAREED